MRDGQDHRRVWLVSADGSNLSNTLRELIGPRMVAATVLTGVAAGVGGALLTLLLHLVQHVAFGYTENTFLIGVQRASSVRRVPAMTVGGAVVAPGWWLLRRRVSAQEVSVSRAIRDTDPRLPIAATVSDALLQIVAVGAGASLGREGAPRRVGAATAGWIAARLALSITQRRTMLACGAGAGLAAVYNVPLGGALFTAELLLGSVALRHIIPALVTALIATVVAWPVLSTHPTYRLATVHLHRPVLVWCLLVGPLAGVVAVGFVRVMAAARIRAVKGVHVLVSIPLLFAAVGALAIAYPQLLGNGKGAAELAFTASMSLGLGAALLVLKPLATAACLGSGAAGGLLTPALATGAALGVLTGRVWGMMWPGASVTEYAMIAAAALLAATQRAPVTAIVLTLEFTGTGVALLLPMLAAVVLAVATSSTLSPPMTPPLLTTRRMTSRPQS